MPTTHNLLSSITSSEQFPALKDSIPEARCVDAADITEAPTGTPILISDLPKLVEPIARFIHAEQPARIMAVDRGARLGALALIDSYKRMYGQPLPTRTGSIEFIRVTNDEQDSEQAVQQIIPVLNKPYLINTEIAEQRPLELLFLDDWVKNGDTAQRIMNATESIGITTDRIAFATLCGKGLQGVRHIIGDPENMTRNSVWNCYQDMNGLEYLPDGPVVLHGDRREESVDARLELAAASKAYYTAGAVETS